MSLSSNVNDLAGRIATEFNTLRSEGSVPVVISETPPTTVDGKLWFNSATGVLYIKFDSTWVQATPAIEGPTGPQGVPGKFTVSETAPVSPSEGDAWLCNAATGDLAGKSFIWYDGYWIEMTPGSIGPQGPAGADGATGPTGPTANIDEFVAIQIIGAY